MEEAEALCQRIGIMAKGTLRCLAEPLRLKQLYGPGFKLFANSLEDKTVGVCEYLESVLPQGWKKADTFATNTSYEFIPGPGILGQLFRTIEADKKRVGILDWGLGQTTLEEVFVKIISEADASAEY
jgi:ABC-type multidrug transport system ATPase subunit